MTLSTSPGRETTLGAMIFDAEDLSGHLLDTAVSLALGGSGLPAPYSTSWELSGPIIAEAGIASRRHSSGTWYAMASADLGDGERAFWTKMTARGGEQYGPYSYQVRKRQQRFSGDTMLVAALRCLVASKLGAVVSLPAAGGTA